jgi:hypothetical protein
MENFKSALEAFLRKELERDKLVRRLKQVLKQTPVLYTQIRSYLRELHQAKRLSTEDYSVLNSLTEPPEKTRRRTSSHSLKSTTVPRSYAASSRHSSWSRPSEWEDNEEIKRKPGLVICDNYRLEEKLGEGGMGVVWKAIDLIQEAGDARDSHVAIKFFSRDFKHHPDALRALVREFDRYQRLNHPNIVKAHNLDHFGSTFFMVMELLKGVPLNEFIKTHPNGLSLTEAKPIIKGMADALAHAHQKGIAHLDFKPANVFYDPDQKIAKVIDFGIARPLDPTEREKTRFDPGTLQALTDAYASYEMLSDLDPDQRDDIYGLACVTYELLSGKHPFNRKTAITAKDEKRSPKPLPGLKPQQNKALLRGLAFHRNDRTPTADEFLADLFQKKPEHPLGCLVGVMLLLLVIVAGFAAWEHFKSHGGDTPPSKFLEEEQLRQADKARLAEQQPEQQEAARKREEEAAHLAAEQEAAQKREEEAARLAAEQEAARKREEEAARLAAEQEAARKREEEAARLAAEQEAARKREEAARQCEQSTVTVNTLLKKAEKDMQENRFIYPSGENALEKSQQVLALCPGNEQAQAILGQMAEFYENKAKEKLKKGHIGACRDNIENGLRAVPEHRGLVDLKARCPE